MAEGGVPETQFARRGDLFVASTAPAVLPVGVDSDDPPREALVEAFAAAYDSLYGTLRSRGHSPDEVGRVHVTIPRRSLRPFINEGWLELHPDEDRPARRTTTAPLGPGGVVQLSAIGVAAGSRKAVHLEGLAHKDPLPNGVRIGDYFFSSVLTSDLPTGGRPRGTKGIEQAWQNFEAFVAASGATLDDVLSVWVYLGEWDLHDKMRDGWLSRYPDESRPTRKTFHYPETPIQLMCDGVVGRGPRVTYELDGIQHHDPIPLAASIGTALSTSGVNGVDRTSHTLPETPLAQAEQAADNLTSLLATTPHGLDSLLEVVGLARDDEGAAALESVRPRLGTGPDAPVFQVLRLGQQGRASAVQFLSRCSLPTGVAS